MSDSSARARLGATWLPRALLISALLHGMAWAIGALASSGGMRTRQVETVDIEVAPAAPQAEILPQEKPPVSEPAATASSLPRPPETPTPEEEGVARPPMDAGVPIDAFDAAPDAPPDAPPRKKKKKPKPDAAPVAPDASDADASPDAPDANDAGDSDATPAVAAAMPDGGPIGDGAPPDGALLGDGALATTMPDGGPIADSGVTAFDPEAGLGDTPTSAGTASNLLAYFPQGHLVTVLIRFDRLRGTRWSEAAEKLFRPMPDYRSLFGGDAKLVDRFDTLVISTPRPRDPTATTLAAKSKMSRPELRRFFEEQGTAVTWTTTRGGTLGVRSGGRTLPGDTRVILSPQPGWFYLAPPADLPGLTTPTRGNLDAATAQGKLPEWLARSQTIEAESGTDRGPALIVTGMATRARWRFPDLGLGVTSIPGPERITVAMELVKQGWVVRGNVKLATDVEAEELATSVETVRQRVADSALLQAMLRRGRALNAVLNLTVKRTGQRVSFATSLSIKDAEIFMQLAAVSVEQYFGQGGRAAPELPITPEPPQAPQAPQKPQAPQAPMKKP